VSSTAALYYYGQNEQTESQNQRYIGELSSALATYRSLSADYNASLGDYGTTLSLLAGAVANLNTSTPAYRNASLELSSLWNSYERLAAVNGRRALSYEVRMLLDFGNGTRRWYNDSSAEPGWNGYVTTLVLLKGDVQAVWYPQFGEHFITQLAGVSQTASEYWGVWQYSGGQWTYLQSGVDLLDIHNGTTFGWALCGLDASYKPTCTP
jgi:hypothetical protein